MSIAMALIATLLVGSVLVYWHAVDKVDTEMRAAIGVSRIIAQNAVDDTEDTRDPRRRLELLVAEFDGDRHIQATLFDSQQQILRTSRIDPPARPIPAWLVWLLDREPDRIQVNLPAVFDGHGKVFLQNNPMNEIAEAWEDARLYLGLFAAFSFVTLLVTVATVGRVLAPIAALQAAFARMGSGDYATRVLAAGPPELLRLCHGFNDMGARLEEMDQKTRALRQQLDRVQEEERAELARNLHDDMSPLLFSVDVDATMIRQLAGSGHGDRMLERTDAIRQAVAQMKGQVKSILGRLRPAILVDLGLATALDDLASQWRARHPGVTFNIKMKAQSLGDKLDAALFHIIRESVSNALRHGSPTTVDIDVRRQPDGTIVLEVLDDGRGVDSAGLIKGFGTRGMSERAQAIGGTLTIRNRQDASGVRVAAEFPASGGDPIELTVQTT